MQKLGALLSLAGFFVRQPYGLALSAAGFGIFWGGRCAAMAPAVSNPEGTVLPGDTASGADSGPAWNFGD
jgi:hypothetical protein